MTITNNRSDCKTVRLLVEHGVDLTSLDRVSTVIYHHCMNSLIHLHYIQDDIAISEYVLYQGSFAVIKLCMLFDIDINCNNKVSILSFHVV